MLRFDHLAIAWGIIILILTLAPGAYMPQTPSWDIIRFDVFAHFFVFAVFVFLLSLGFAQQTKRKTLSNHPMIIGIALGIIYGFVIEMGQGFVPGRGFEYIDMLANSIGSLTGAGAANIIRKI